MFFRSGRIVFPPASRPNVAETGHGIERVELDLARDRHARAAMEAYADSCAADLPWLAETLRTSRFGRSARLTQCSPTVLRVFVAAQARAAAQPDYAHAAWEHVRAHLTALLSGSVDGDTHGDGHELSLEPAPLHHAADADPAGDANAPPRRAGAR